MYFLISLLQIFLPILYFSSICVYAIAFFKNIKYAEILKSPLLYFTMLVHAVYIIIRTIEFHHPPITTVLEILTLLAFTIIFVYTYIEVRTKIKSTGYFILILPFLFQIVSSIFIKEVSGIPPILRSNLLGFHVTSALFGYAAIAISATYGFLYLMLYHEIKSRQFGVIYKRLPNLEILERMSFTATLFGFILLSIAIIVGLVWLPKAVEDYSYSDPKLVGTIAIWLIYALGLSAKKIIGWQGRKIMVFSILSFAIAIFSMTIINMFFSGFHNFY